MTCPNSCSGNFNLGSLRNPCHIPLSSSNALCPTDVSRGDVLCFPSRYQNGIWLMDNCQETCREPTRCQSQNCEPSNCETSCCSSTAYYGPTPCQGTGFLPAASYTSRSCLPISCQPLSSVSNSCGPLSRLTYGCHPLGWMPCGAQPLGVVSSSLRPLHPLFSKCQALTHVFSPCRPSCFALGGQ